MYREGPNLTFDTDSKVVFVVLERMNSAVATIAMMAINEVVR